MGSKFKWIFTLLVALTMQLSFAQEKTVSGTITENNLPLPGANVIVKGTTRSTQTDIDGKYSISAKAGEVLEFSYLGMKTKTATVGASNTISITMEEDAAILGEVVVTAYGTQKKESIAGSIAEIKSEEIAKISTGNVVQGLTGKVAGVQIINNNGMPGDPPVVRFRGVGSVNASSAPIYVVDGVVFSGDIASINSQDIQSISFLKDASAAALYGSRGANGVIIVTTKKGKEGKAKISLDSKIGFSSRAVKEYNIMKSPKEFYEAHYQTLKNFFQFGSPGLDEDAAASAALAGLITGDQGLDYNVYDVPNNELIDTATGQLNPNARLMFHEDWDDYLYKTGTFTQTHLSVNGGSEKTNYFLSLGYEKNDGYIVNSGFQKITSRLNINSEISDRFKIGSSLSYTNLQQKLIPGYEGGTAGGTYSNPFYWTRTVGPIYPVHLFDTAGNPVFDANGNQLYDDGTGVGAPGLPIRPFGAIQNPYATALLDIWNYQSDNVFATAFAEVELFDGLSFNYTVAGDLTFVTNQTMSNRFYGNAVGAGGRVGYDSRRTLSFTNQQFLKYNKRFGKHGIDALLGHETLDRQINHIEVGRSKLLISDGYVNHAQVVQLDENGSYGIPYGLEGFFGRLNYDFDNKYYINASLRRDGSSTFAPENRWGTFYGVGAAWRISQESFLKDVSWLNELKIKGSYGEQGNDNLGLERPYLSLFSLQPTATPDLDFPLDQQTRGNREITWEKNANMNVGFEMSFIDRRFNIEAEYFSRKVSDMLFFKPLPTSSGFETLPENIGDMENIGYEVTVSADVVRKKDFQLSFNINATHYKNEVTKLSQTEIPNGIYRYKVGESAFDFYLREFAGVDPTNGDAQFYKTDETTGEKVIADNYADADLYFVGKSALPDVYGGFGLDAKYKGFDAAINFAYQMGGYGYDGNWMSMMSPSVGENYHRDFADTWTVDNPTASLPRLDTADPEQFYSASTLGLIKSDYLSIQNISAGYTFDSATAARFGLSSFRIYGLIDNVALWSKRQGYDPRLSLTGQSDNKYSLLRTVSFGVNVQF